MNSESLSSLFISIISGLLIWAITLMPSLLIRYLFLKRPLGKVWAIVTVAILWTVNYVLFIEFNIMNISHIELIVIALISYNILRRMLPINAKWD